MFTDTEAGSPGVMCGWGWDPLPAPPRVCPRPQAWLQVGNLLVYGGRQSHSSPREMFCVHVSRLPSLQFFSKMDTFLPRLLVPNMRQQERRCYFVAFYTDLETYQLQELRRTSLSQKLDQASWC